MQKSQIRSAISAKVAAETEVNSRKDGVPDIAADILTSQKDHRRICREKSKHRLRRKLDQQIDDHTVCNRNKNGIAQGFCRPVMLPGADILRCERGDSCQHRRRHDKERPDHLFHDPDRRRVVQSPVICDHRDNDKRDLDTAILYRHRDSDLEDPRKHHPLWSEIFAGKPDPRLPSADRPERDHHAQRLCERRPKRRSRRSHIKAAHKQVIERYVGNTGDTDEIHRASGISHSTKNGADDVVSCDKGNPHKTDRQILSGAFDRLLRRSDQMHDGRHAHQQHGCHHDRDHHEKRDRIADSQSCLFLSVRSHGAADRHRRAHCQSDNDDGEHVHDLSPVGNRGDTVHPTVLSNDKQIRHPIKRLKKIREKIGQCKEQDRL